MKERAKPHGRVFSLTRGFRLPLLNTLRNIKVPLHDEISIHTKQGILTGLIKHSFF